MPRGIRAHSELRGGRYKRPARPKVCSDCGAPLFRGITCPRCEADLIELFILCVYWGEAKISFEESLFLGIDWKPRGYGKVAV